VTVVHSSQTVLMSVVEYKCSEGNIHNKTTTNCVCWLKDRIINRYSVQHQTWNWTKNLFCSFVDMNTLNSFPLLMTCKTKVTYRAFRLGLASNFI